MRWSPAPRLTLRWFSALGFAAIAATAVLALPLSSCTIKQPPSATYFDQQIEPLLQGACARASTNAGCHVADARGDAFGNLDVSSFANINKRRDLLVRYGPYLQSGLLLKALPPETIQVQTWDGKMVEVVTDIRHTGGPILDPMASGYFVLRQWIDKGAQESGTPPPVPPLGTGPCSTAVPNPDGYDLSADPAAADFADFKQNVIPVLKQSCAMGTCHGSLANALYFACGDAPDQIRYDYYKASDYLAPLPNQSELVRRPLAPAEGGSFHEGGIIFPATTDPGYQAMLAWATQHGPPSTAGLAAGFDFFAHRVQPVLVRKGCMQMQCHSGASFHDFRLRGGSLGAFSLSATKQNYKLALAQLALESDDPVASRIVRKGITRPQLGGDGITHRGGPLLEDFQGAPPSAALCDAQPYDYDNGDINAIPAFCVFREWLRRERANRPALAPLSGIVYVRRALSNNPDRFQDFDVYTPGADLRRVDATLANGSITLGTDQSLMTGCGLDPNTADVRRPMVSWDGGRVAFAARSSASAPLRIYEMKADGSACAPLAGLAAPKTTDNGLLVHDFDPAYGPPTNGVQPIVFASTRGNLDASAYDYTGAQRTPADPSKPNADLFVYEPDPANTGQMRVRQLTFLLNTERMPAFMPDGRVIFTIEKRTPGLSQVSLRRINLDGGDYHPLYASRGSLGFRAVSQVVQMADKNFVAIFADENVPHRGGTLGIFNRTIGIDFLSSDPSDYVVDPDVLDPNSLHARDPAFFLHSLLQPDPGATGRATGALTGVYASPSPLPSNSVLVSWGAATDAASFNGDYDVYMVDPSLGTRTLLFGTPGQAESEAVAIYGRPPRATYVSVPGQPNAYKMDPTVSSADVTIHDMPVFASIFLQNTPTGREIETLPSMEIWGLLPPPLDADSFTAASAAAFVTSDAFGQLIVRKRLLGPVPINADGSTRYKLPGGMPFAIHLPDTDLSKQRNLPRWVNEQFMFSPGESVHSAFPRAFFNSFCGNCHGSISGKALDIAQRADLMSNASSTTAFGQTPIDLNLTPAQRGPILGP